MEKNKMKDKKPNQDLVGKIRTPNGALQLIMDYAGVGGCTYTAPVDLLLSLQKMGRKDEADGLAKECFRELIFQDAYDEAEKCARVMTKESLDKAAYETLSKLVDKKLESGGRHRKDLDKASKIYLRICDTQNYSGEK